MRISTQSFYQQSQRAMNSQQANLMRSQEKIGAMTRILTPSDDPVAAARALGVSESLALNAQYQGTRGEAIHTLSLEENALQSVTGVLQDVKTLIVQAGSVLTDADRRTIATALESAHAQLLGLANTDDGNGQFLFAGFRSGSPPFVRNAAGDVIYQGDQGQRMMQVDVSRQIPGTDDGRSLFQSVQGGAGYVTSELGVNLGSGVFGPVSVMDASDPLYGRDFSISFLGGDYTVMTKDVPPVAVGVPTPFTPGVPISFGGLQISISGTPADGDVVEVRNARNAGTDLFGTISELVAALRVPLEGGDDTDRARLLNALSTSNVRVNNAHDNVLTVRSSVGSRLHELDLLNDGGQARTLMDKSHLSDLQDLDYGSAITEFYQRQSALQATQQTFLRIQQISLLNLL